MRRDKRVMHARRKLELEDALEHDVLRERLDLHALALGGLLLALLRLLRRHGRRDAGGTIIAPPHNSPEMLAVAALLLACACVDAKKIYGLAYPGGHSHRLLMAKIGKELVSRGHEASSDKHAFSLA